MDPRCFDTLICALGARLRRRRLALLPVALGAAAWLAPGSEQATAGDRRTRKKKARARERRQLERAKHRKRRTTTRCGVDDLGAVRCENAYSCCNLDRSTTAGCTYPGYTTCCRLPAPVFTLGGDPTIRAFADNFRCCPDVSQGINGACPDDFPVCCPGGCCAVGAECGGDVTCVGVSAAAVPWRDLPAGRGRRG